MTPDSLVSGDKVIVRGKGKNRPYTLRKRWADGKGWWAWDRQGKNHALLDKQIRGKAKHGTK